MKEEALKARLKFIALEKNMTFNQIWKQLLLERFLARLSVSEYQRKLIFKGGLLLANYMDIGRETMDIDFSLKELTANTENIKTLFTEICDIQLPDNLTFRWDKVEPLEQFHMQYTGYRVFLNTIFEKMKDKIQIDIGIGDITEHKEGLFPSLKYKNRPIFHDEIKLLMYPAESIFSEKLESIISKGDINSRMKDYHDLLLMIRENELLDFESLQHAIHKTFNHRNTMLEIPISFDEEGIQTLQRLWTNHVRGLAIHQKRLNIPDTITEVIEEINDYLTQEELVV